MRSKQYKVTKWEAVFEILRLNGVEIKYHYAGKRIPRVVIDQVGDIKYASSERDQEFAELDIYGHLLEKCSDEFVSRMVMSND